MPEFDENREPASLDEIDERIDHGEFWTQFASNLGFESPAAARDEHDRDGWRETERARIRCLDLMEHPPRRRSPTLGVFGPTEVRQVNVKLTTADFDALRVLADEGDVPPTTMARMLLRTAVRQAINEPRG